LWDCIQWSRNRDQKYSKILSAIHCLRTFNDQENEDNSDEQGEFAGSGTGGLDISTSSEKFEYKSGSQADE
jgi:hypothetical protein